MQSVRGWTGLLLPLLLNFSSATPQTPKAASLHQQIVVKVRNGKTGLPIWFASPYVFLGKTDPKRFTDSFRHTLMWGDARVDVSSADPAEVRVWVDFLHRDCRAPEGDDTYRVFDLGGRTLNNMAVYSLDTILKTGVVAPNLCGSKTQSPQPGVLTIYVLPATFKEQWQQ